MEPGLILRPSGGQKKSLSSSRTKLMIPGYSDRTPLLPAEAFLSDLKCPMIDAA